MNLKLELERLYNDDRYGYYIGGSLCIDNIDCSYLVNISNKKLLITGSEEQKERDLSEDEFYIACKLYLKHKSKLAAFYKVAKEEIESHS